MKRVLVGIDISKAWLDYAICTQKELQPSPAKRIDNDVKGICKMLKSLLKKHRIESLWICFEHTGHYGLLLSSILQSQGITYTAIPAMEVKKSLGITRGKSDQVDARRLAEYAASHLHKLQPSQLPSEELLRVKSLLAYRAQLTKIKTQFVNSLESYKTAAQVIKLDFICEDLMKKVEGLKMDIKALDKQIETLIHSNESLGSNYKLISSVKGIGLVVAAFMLVQTHNFTTFDDPRKFNCFTGLAPFEHSSGINKSRSKTSHYRHKYLKSLLFNGANSAAQHDPQLKKYYERKKNEGKHHLTIMNAIACKLVSRAFATVKRQSPYVVLNY